MALIILVHTSTMVESGSVLPLVMTSTVVATFVCFFLGSYLVAPLVLKSSKVKKEEKSARSWRSRADSESSPGGRPVLQVAETDDILLEETQDRTPDKQADEIDDGALETQPPAAELPPKQRTQTQAP
eukprot:SAG22_NODE_37_length_26837_cov_8.103523_7_plen_128_part_00